MIQNNRTVTSEGGYRSKSKYNRYVLDNVSNEIDNILKKYGYVDPRTTAFVNKPKTNRISTTTLFRSNTGNGISTATNTGKSAQALLSGDTDPRFYGQKEPLSSSVALESAQQAQSANRAPQEQKQSVLQRYASKDSMYKNQGKGTAALFNEKPDNLCSFTKDDWNRTRGTGIAEVAGSTESIRKFADKVNNTRKNGYVLTPMEQQLYGSKGVADVAGNGDLYDWTKDVKDFFATNSELDTPLYRDRIAKGEKITNVFEHNAKAYEDPENWSAWIPKWRDQRKRDDGFMETYEEAERILNQEEFDNSLEADIVASLNRFSAMPANTLATILSATADGIDSLTGNQKSEFCDWLRSMENNNELLQKSERQYSQVFKDNEFVNGLITGISKELVDISSEAFIGGLIHMPAKALSAINSATEIYNVARENGYSIEEAIGESGSMLAVNAGVSLAYDLMKDNVKNESVKSVLEILKNTTTKTNKNAWLENNGEKGALSLEGIANTLAVETGVQVITKGAPYLLGKFAKLLLA